jgi:Tfp pilus assembly protein PilF
VLPSGFGGRAPAQSGRVDSATATAPVEVDEEDLGRLMSALQAYRRDRWPQWEYDERQAGLVRATCLTIIAGQVCSDDLNSRSQFADQTRMTLSEVGPGDLPEAQGCRLWLACAAGAETSDTARQFVGLVREDLWEPVKFLAYRALAHAGRRQILAATIPQEGPLTLAQADAWLEAAHAVEGDPRWTDRITTAEALLPPAVCEKWLTLVKAESGLAYEGHTQAVESQLMSLMETERAAAPLTYVEAVTQYIASRAAAAVLRLRLSAWREEKDIFNSFAGRQLPAWERDYLRGLLNWQRNDLSGARMRLESALQQNPDQTPIRLALASVLAVHSLNDALTILEYEAPTRELCTLRAMLLVRLGDHPKAEGALPENTLGHEALRYSWMRGRKQYRQREHALRAALAEKRGEWDRARKSWRLASATSQSDPLPFYVENIRKALREARQLYLIKQELGSMSTSQGWLRSVLAQRLKRGCYEISKLPLTGDALFFRAAAMTEVFPKRATRDFQALLRQQDWINAERRVGGGRIIFTGDSLLRLGKAADASRAYELTDLALSTGVKERLGVSVLCAAVLNNSDAEAISEATQRATRLVPNSPWPLLLAGLGHLIAGDTGAAHLEIENAKEKGAPEATYLRLQSLCTAMSGSAEATNEELPRLTSPDAIDAVISFLCGAGGIAAVKDLISDGWITRCLTNPQLTARRLVADWCEAGKWDEAFRAAGALGQSPHPWAKELAALLHIRHALERTVRGEFGEADGELQEAETLLRREGD